MEKPKKLSLQKEIEQDVQRIEEEIANHPELEDIQVTEEMDAALLSKIREYENANAAKNEPRKSVVRYKKKKTRWIVALAAVLVLVLGLGMTSVGSKSYWKELLSVLIGDESAKVIDVEDMSKQMTEDLDELQVCQELDKKMGRALVWMRYKPLEMELKRFEFDEELQMARLFYRYKDGIVLYSIYAGLDDSSWTVKEEDTVVEEYTQTVNDVEIKIKGFQSPNQLEIRKVVSFDYKGIHYELKGVLDKDELTKILENLYFL